LNPFNLADRELVFGPVVELGGAGRLMRSHLLGMLEPAAVLHFERFQQIRIGQLLFDRCFESGKGLNPGSYMERPCGRELYAMSSAPFKKLPTSAGVREVGPFARDTAAVR
jgi:hypothetical protein